MFHFLYVFKDRAVQAVFFFPKACLCLEIFYSGEDVWIIGVGRIECLYSMFPCTFCIIFLIDCPASWEDVLYAKIHRFMLGGIQIHVILSCKID